jgi:hypothetical protein
LKVRKVKAVLFISRLRKPNLQAFSNFLLFLLLRFEGV